MGKVKLTCDMCGRDIFKYPSQIKRHNFCSRECLRRFSSKSENPMGYGTLKDLTKMGQTLTALNKKLNPTRMNDQTKEKLRAARLGSGAGSSYEKFYGRHTHRIVAEIMLGRQLLPGEVVHHIDGNKRNNKPSNLKVFQSQADHAKWHKEHEGGGAR